MITLSKVCLEQGGKILFDEIDFTINYEETIGLIGRNGAGKSTLLKMICGKIHHDSGKIDVPEWINIGYLEQHFNFEKSTLLDEVCKILDHDRENERWKGEKILFGLGFSKEDFLKNPKDFSGGWQVRINLATLLLSEPDIMLLDEPTNHLDLPARRWLEKYIKGLKIAVVVITHDFSFLQSITKFTAIIHRGKVIKAKCTAEKIRNQIDAIEEQYEKTRLAEEKKRKETLDWAAKFGSKASKASAVQSKLKLLDKQEVKEKISPLQAINFKFKYLETSSLNAMIELKNVSFGYDLDNLLIKNFNLSVLPGEKICIIGKNGKGKSTLLKVMAKQLKILSGEVIHSPKLQAGYFWQMNKEDYNPHNTILEELKSVDESIDLNIIRRVAASMLFNDSTSINKEIKVLSGGEKNRLALAKIILQPKNCLILDEPTNHLDLESVEALKEAIIEYKGSVVIVTHEEDVIRSVANKLVIFKEEGATIFNGTYDDFLEKIGWDDEK